MPSTDTARSNGNPCWIDLMVADAAAARKLSCERFGWDIQNGPTEAYLASDENGAFHVPP